MDEIHAGSGQLLIKRLVRNMTEGSDASFRSPFGTYSVRDYANLRSLANGGISGRISEWPLLPVEAESAVNEIDALRNVDVELSKVIGTIRSVMPTIAANLLKAYDEKEKLKIRGDLHEELAQENQGSGGTSDVE